MEEGIGEQMVMDGDLTWDGVRTIHCTGRWWNCAPELCIVLLTSYFSKFRGEKETKNK